MDKVLTIVIAQLKEVINQYDKALNSAEQTKKDENSFRWHIQSCEGGIQALLRVLTHTDLSSEQRHQVALEIRQLADQSPIAKERIAPLFRKLSTKNYIKSREGGNE
ncbi:MAG: hypothetical protein AAB575_05315 [Patescibacteria group bacterium]